MAGWLGKLVEGARRRAEDLLTTLGGGAPDPAPVPVPVKVRPQAPDPRFPTRQRPRE